MTWILPLIIAVVYLKGYYDTFAGMGNAALAGWMVFGCALLIGIFAIVNYRKKN
jgi:NSS family neurotransmitter:Na+ symporter